jgi:uncharacterized protein (UPF0548 family)
MILLRRPSPEAVRKYIERQRIAGFSYAAVGGTAGTLPGRYTVDHTRVALGKGEHVFHAAKAALTQWRQFNLGWVQARPNDTPLQTGAAVALNACQIVYTIDESSPHARFGFAYGTIGDHAESGEERFLVEWDDVNDQVWYDILAFSRPRLWLARIGYPFTRRVQKKFGRESAAAMQSAVATAR